MESISKLPFYCVIIPLIASFCMPVFARWKKEVCAPLATLTTAAVFILSLIVGYHVSQGQILSYAVSGWDPPWGIEMMVDSLSAIMMMLISGISLFILIFSFVAIKYELERIVTGWYYTAFLLCLSGMVGLVVSNDIFNMYVLIEIAGISACALVAAKGTRLSTEAALKYLLLATIGSGFILFGIGFI